MRTRLVIAGAVLSAAAIGCGESRTAGSGEDSRTRAEAAVVEGSASSGDVGNTRLTDTEGVVEIHTIGNEIVLGLAHDTVYMGLSDSLLTKTRADMARDERSDTGDVGDMANAFAGAIKKSVGTALGTRVRYPVSDIESVRYENGEIKFEYRHKHAMSFESVSTDHRKALADFAPADARHFVSAVNIALRNDENVQ